MSVNASARRAMKILLDEAERRDYNPPVPSSVVAELEWIIAHTWDHSMDAEEYANYLKECLKHHKGAVAALRRKVSILREASKKVE